MNCIFCQIVKGEIESRKIYEDTDIIIILDIDPISEGHTLIIPKKHFNSLKQTPDLIITKMIKSAKIIGNILETKFHYPTRTLFITDGAAMDVPHIHTHIFGRKSKDEIIWSENPLPDNTKFEEIYNIIRDALKN